MKENKAVVLLNTIVSVRRVFFHSKSRECNTWGFTLIELLVVVLIIGILAAVAVPQYQKAVEKSRAVQALALLETAYKHAVMYYMANGTYPNTFDEMGMDVPWPATSDSSLKWVRLKGATDTRSNGTWSFQLYHTEAGDFMIYMGLVKGKYAGAGFLVSIVSATGELANKDIWCAERTKQGIIFSTDLNAGDYCVKIMSGTDNGSPGTFRRYTLP